jgi:hypothetical protein
MLPFVSHVGPSANLRSLASFSSFAPGAMTLSATAGEKPARPKQINPARRANNFFAIIRNNLRQSKILGDKKMREGCEGEKFSAFAFFV